MSLYIKYTGLFGKQEEELEIEVFTSWEQGRCEYTHGLYSTEHDPCGPPGSYLLVVSERLRVYPCPLHVLSYFLFLCFL